jgi:hypothetical protein
MQRWRGGCGARLVEPLRRQQDQPCRFSSVPAIATATAMTPYLSAAGLVALTDSSARPLAPTPAVHITVRTRGSRHDRAVRGKVVRVIRAPCCMNIPPTGERATSHRKLPQRPNGHTGAAIECYTVTVRDRAAGAADDHMACDTPLGGHVGALLLTAVVIPNDRWGAAHTQRLAVATTAGRGRTGVTVRRAAA